MFLAFLRNFKVIFKDFFWCESLNLGRFENVRRQILTFERSLGDLSYYFGVLLFWNMWAMQLRIEEFNDR